MDMFGFNNMSDDEFRREFLRLLDVYRSGMNGYMGYINKPNIGRTGHTSEDDMFKRIMGSIPNNDLDTNKGTDDDGSDWESRTWNSPDGLTNFRSFSRGMGFPEQQDNSSNELDTLDLLKSKLNKAIIDEDYESASKIRDIIITYESGE